MLARAPWGWGWQRSYIDLIAPIANPGGTASAGASNVDGANASVLNAVGTTRDVEFMVISIGGTAVSGAACRVLVDILVDPAGGSSYTPLINDLLGGFTSSADAAGQNCTYYFPIWIKAGTQIGVRARTQHTSAIATGRVSIAVMGQPSRPDMWWCGQAVESLGINASTSSGTDVTMALAGTWGSWTAIGTTTRRYGALQMGLDGSDASPSTMGGQWQIGVGSAQYPGTHTMHHSLSSTGPTMTRDGVGPLNCDIPAGTALQVRASASNVPTETLCCALYGVY